MTITLTLPDDLYRRVLELAGRHQVSAERLAAAVLAEQIAQWGRIERLAAEADREQFLRVMDKVPNTDPVADDRL